MFVLFPLRGFLIERLSIHRLNIPRAAIWAYGFIRRSRILGRRRFGLVYLTFCYRSSLCHRIQDDLQHDRRWVRNITDVIIQCICARFRSSLFLPYSMRESHVLQVIDLCVSTRLAAYRLASLDGRGTTLHDVFWRLAHKFAPKNRMKL